MSAIATGLQLENVAIEFLQNVNAKILCRNYHCRYGEVDLIAVHNAVLLFIEVRYRKNAYFGTPAETVTLSKQKKIINAAEIYLQSNRDAQQFACRFDVIAITNSLHNPEIEWIKDAFHA